MKCLTSSLWSTPRREFQQPFASLSRSALRPGQPVVPHHQPITPAWDTEPEIDEDKARRNTADCERLAVSRGLRIRTDSAGTEPDAEFAPAVAAALRAEGVDLGGKQPRLVKREDVARADRVVAFGCDLGDAARAGVKIEQWTDVPNVSDGLPAARAAIRAHLERLLDEWKTP